LLPPAPLVSRCFLQVPAISRTPNFTRYNYLQ
jgi:hypothetical protein